MVREYEGYDYLENGDIAQGCRRCKYCVSSSDRRARSVLKAVVLSWCVRAIFPIGVGLGISPYISVSATVQVAQESDYDIFGQQACAGITDDEREADKPPCSS